jgi:hypothetical protein
MNAKFFRKPDPFDVALWGLAVTFAIAVIYYLQLRSMQDTVELSRQAIELSRKAMEVDQRPWLSVQAAPQSALSFVNGKQAVIGMTFSIKNVGKSVARDVQVDSRMFATDTGIPVALDASQNQRNLCDHPQPVPSFGTFDVFPSAEPVEVIQDISVLPSAIASKAASATGDEKHSFVSFYIVGCVTYHFSFGTDIHQTRFAYHLMGPIFRNLAGKPIMGAFEVGVDVPKDRLAVMKELLASNKSN